MHFFILTFLLAFTIGNVYVITHGWQLLEATGKFRWIYLGFMLLLSVMFIAGILLKRPYDNAFTDILWKVGSWWMVIMLYSTMALLCFDVVRLVLLLFGKRLSVVFINYPQIKLILFSLCALLLLVIMALGYRNATRPEVTTKSIVVAKDVPENMRGRELNIVAVSDLHLGVVFTNRHVQRWANKINELQPDIIFFVGDTFDDNPAPVMRKNMGAIFEQLRAPLGVYAVTGNHEMMGQPEAAMNYLAQHGMRPLMDEAVLVDSAFYVVGRLDRAAHHRLSIAALTDSLDKSKPIIVLDHQPYEWDESVAVGVDIQLAGHTHHGQLWPLNHVTERIYQKDWGYLQKGQTHFYTSCGMGVWGAPVRTAGHSEIVQLNVKFE